MDDSYDQLMDSTEDRGLTINLGNSGADLLEEEDTHPRRSTSYHHSSSNHNNHDDGGRRRGDDADSSDRDRERERERERERGRDDYHRRRRDSRDYGSNGAIGGSGTDGAGVVASAAIPVGPAAVRGRSRSPARPLHEDSYRDHRAYETSATSRDDKYETDRGDRGSERRASDYGRAPRGGRSRSRSPVSAPAAKGVAPNFLRDRRVYVGNLAYDVSWTDLKDFMRGIGPVAHADVLLGHDGRSKGCGVVEFQTAEDAKTAIRKMNDVVLRGRPVFVREDRESGERIGVSGRVQSSRSADLAIRQVFVGNLPFSVHWKDLKDMFRRAGPVDRADVFMNNEMRSKGSGIVLFERASDVQRAIYQEEPDARIVKEEETALEFVE
ncbi:hypothetical protein BGW39_006275 [Mortierella sp. 14UC]|nr:hypothetical protein BGW39_006275 [Mortierella sp. 14UC]